MFAFVGFRLTRRVAVFAHTGCLVLESCGRVDQHGGTVDDEASAKGVAVKRVLLIGALLVGCGGRAATSGEPSSSGAGASATGSARVAAMTPGLGPIDQTGLPTELPIYCAKSAPAEPRLKLPCQAGIGIGALSVVECFDLDDQSTLSFGVSFDNLPALLNRSVQIPFDSVPGVPTGGPGTLIEGVSYTGQLSGTAVFSQVDVVGRSFIATLSNAQIAWSGSDGTQFSCIVPSTPLWAVAGDFE